MTFWVLTGANRGLGLEFIRQLAADKNNVVFAGVRESSTDITDLKKAAGDGRVTIATCDTADQSSIQDFASQITKKLERGKIDYLLNVAAINTDPDIKIFSSKTSSSVPSTTLKKDVIDNHMNINVLGLAGLTAALEPLLQDGSVVMNMTSGLGSMQVTKGIKPSKCVIYSISKAAVNMLTLHMADEFRQKSKEVTVIAMDPGWVKTRMGGEEAEIDADKSIGGMLKILTSLTLEDSGKFYGYSGAEVPW